jgi:two-component system sensor histidine kinase KdpD
MNKECRPDPDSLLRRLQHEEQEEASQSRGQLKIFLGPAAGVGKTYQMLEEAHSLKKGCVDVVIAIVETHGRPETEVLLEGLDVIPRRRIERSGIVLEEMDLDAVLARHPAIALVDELAHTNAPGSRHAKRYQDVEELLEAGISVCTTLNIQHIESLNDVVYQITGVRVSETLPDSILELADEIEMVDLPPEELLQRFKDGKVYMAPQAEQAVQRFFRKGNLLGLRELALRYAARKVDVDMRSYMESQGILGPWPAGSQLLVCISNSPLSERLVRIGQRMAADLDAEWFAVNVESPQEETSTEAAKDQLARNMRLAEELGAKVQVLIGRNIAEEIISFARGHNVTLIVVGLPEPSLRKRWLRGSVVNELIKHSGQIHVLVIGSTEAEKKRPEATVPSVGRNWLPFYGSLISVAAMTGFCWIFHSWLGLINTAMMLILPVVYSGMTWGRRAGLIASLMAVIALDFFFVPPQLSLAVVDLRYLPVFLVFIVVGIVTSFLADLIRWQGESARQRERFVSALYAFSRDLMETGNLEELLRYAAREIADAFECEVMILLPDETGQLKVRAQRGEHVIFDERKLGVATWVYLHGQQAGHGTETLSSATFSYLPLITKEVTIGVLGVGLGRADQFLLPEQRRLLEAFTNILALALSRTTNSSSNKEDSK